MLSSAGTCILMLTSVAVVSCFLTDDSPQYVECVGSDQFSPAVTTSGVSTIEECVEYCRARNYTFAGVTKGRKPVADTGF